MYRRYAAECFALAIETADAGAKRLFSQMAEAWQRLAHRADRPPPPPNTTE